MPRSAIILAIRRAIPAVVSIRSLPQTATEYELHQSTPEISASPDRNDNSSTDTETEAVGGSGFIIGSDGLIVTNKHVVANLRSRHEVFLPDGRWYTATVLAKDPVTDVAFLRVRKNDLAPILLGSAKSLELGEEVIAIGNALGQFSNTASAGIISGLSRSLVAAMELDGEIEELEGLIQTDAAINPGNSGGPLVNQSGEAIGINVASVMGAQSLGFAIPIDIVRRDAEELKRFGRIRRIYLGVRYIPITEEISRAFHLPVQQGALIASDAQEGIAPIIPGSAAHRAGLQNRDIIVAVNGSTITSQRSLAALLAQCVAGESVALTVVRGKRKLDLALSPNEWNEPNTITAPDA